MPLLTSRLSARLASPASARHGFLFAFLLLLSPAAPGHDYWLEPTQFHLHRGAPLEIRLLVGDGFVKELERPMQREPSRSLRLFHGNQVVDLFGSTPDGQIPLVSREVDFTGLGLVAYERGHSYVDMDAEQFSAHLRHEGLVETLTHWQSTGQPGMQRERYSRCIKTLVMSGPEVDASGLQGRVLGHELEILLLENPYRAGQTELSARILLLGAPVPEKLVWVLARSPDGTLSREILVSDANGEIRFGIKRPSVYLVRTLHLKPLAPGSDADWESVWSSYSFAVD